MSADKEFIDEEDVLEEDDLDSSLEEDEEDDGFYDFSGATEGDR